jgi:hypothetical protein
MCAMDFEEEKLKLIANSIMQKEEVSSRFYIDRFRIKSE